jgi:hypothetical protein
MPRLPMNYQNTIIYKLVCKDINITDTYVGHTTNFDKRKCQHKGNCNNENDDKYNIYVYQFIRENGGFNNWEMIEIELYSCENRRQAETRERYWLEQLGATLNSYVPTRTREEYRQENSEQLKEMYKEYREKNPEKIKESRKKFNNMNRDQINEKSNQYYHENRKKILEKCKEKITCECGCELTKSNLPKHRKTKKHLDNLDNLNNLI